jgi:CheY-like chemotaxis protein
MPYRVQDILLASSLYESFTLQEDGRLNELIVGEFLELSLHQTPGLTHIFTGADALRLAEAERRFNLILATTQLEDMDAAELAREARRRGLDVPVVVLAYDNDERKAFMATRDVSDIERVFLWQGNARILVAIVKYLEDKRNVAHDTGAAGVPVILLVEDNVRYYSSFLPSIYTELIHQSERLISEGMNLSHKLVRMRARPKILLTSTFEEAWDLFQRYRPYLLGVISDVEFPRDGVMTREAGFQLAQMIRSELPDLPILLQSSRSEFAAGARAVGATFLRKYSETLLADLRAFMVDYFAFGDFVFRMPNGDEVARAADLRTLEEKLSTVPAASIGFHGERDHFSNWFTARTEFALARKLRPRKVRDFATLEDLRRDLIASIAEYRREQSETLVADFDRHAFDGSPGFFARVGGGSLGGKARGLAFVRYLLNYHQIGRRFAGVRVGVPPAIVLATDVFDRFLVENDLLGFALESGDDEDTRARFLESSLPSEVVEDLVRFLEVVHRPLAVRSSSLLEDSQYQPFTGVYETFMLPNRHVGLAERLDQLMRAIKLVYASAFTQRAKAYLHATPFRLEEEKMAVIVQQVVGATHGSRFYPDFSGVARSHNFYPSPPLVAGDGIAAVALGLGRAVVEGEQCLSFSPRSPRNIVNFSTVEDVLANSQRSFWALEMSEAHETMRESLFGLHVAEADGTLAALASTYSAADHRMNDGLSRAGTRLVTFAPILKHGLFPLADVLSLLVDLGRRGMNRHAEIEFAVRLGQGGEASEFAFLQMRPLVLSRESTDVDVNRIPAESLICRSPRVMGNGRIDGVSDLVVVDAQRFERSQSAQVARDVDRLNAELAAEGRPYILIGVGRWGSNDPWLGIPVTWEQIAGARAIVETGFRDFRVTPSQGSHFFQNLTSFQVGYFTVNEDLKEGFVDWDWLARQPAVSERGPLRHLRFGSPLVVEMDGRRGEGAIYKPETTLG